MPPSPSPPDVTWRRRSEDAHSSTSFHNSLPLGAALNTFRGLPFNSKSERFIQWRKENTPKRDPKGEPENRASHQKTQLKPSKSELHLAIFAI